MADNRTEKLARFEERLAGLVEQYTPAFQNAVEALLQPEERRIFSQAMPYYSQATGRWYDPWGIPDSIPDFLFILNEEGATERERLNALTVLLYHDCGYPKRKESKDYASPELREQHMFTGAAKFAQDAEAHYQTLFTRKETSLIFDAIIKHDDKYLGGDRPASALLCTFIDGDNIFIPSFISAYKDYVSRAARPASLGKDCYDLSGRDFLQVRQAYFFVSEEESRKFSQRIHPDQELSAKYQKKILPIAHKTTKQVLAAHMLARTAECEQGLFDLAYNGDWAAFEPYAKDYLEGSINAALVGESYDWSRYKDLVFQGRAE